MSEFAAAVAALQADLPVIKRTRRGQAGTRRYQYAAYDKILADVKPILASHGFTWHTEPELAIIGSSQPHFVLTYVLTHVASGEEICGQYPLIEGPPQQQGSAISYAKRYCLAAVLDLQIEGEDDDGMAASEPRQRTPARTTGPEHERLRNGTVEATPEDRPAERGPATADPWTDQKSGQLSKPPRPATDGQHRFIHKLFKERGIDDDDVRHGMLSEYVERPITSQKQLTIPEANRVIDRLKGETE